MTKRIISIALVVMMLFGQFSVLPLHVGADLDVQSGTVNNTEASTDTTADLEIATVDDLQAFAAAVNAGDKFAGKKVQLTADLDLAGIQWQPIGGDTVYFAGEFDGNGKTISNLTNTEDVARKGLFGLVEDCYIHDLTLKDVKFSGTASDMRVGALAGNLNNPNWNGTGCIIKNVTVDGLDYDLNDTDGIIGGLIGFSWNSYIKGCTVKNADMNVTGNDSKVSTVIGYGRGVTDNCYVEDFPTYGEYIDEADVNADGGVVNYVDCKAVTAVVNLSGTVYFGGFFGADTYNHWRNTFKNCHVTGLAVTCAEGDGVYTVGGFMSEQAGGYSAEAILDCSVEGTITSNGTNPASTFAGFIGGKWGRTGGATDCTAAVDITAVAGNVAGFCGSVGQYNDNMSYAFNGCTASGDVKTENGTAAGFLATASGNNLNLSLNNNTVSGTVEGTTEAALVGNVASETGKVTVSGNAVPEGMTEVGGNTAIVVDPAVPEGYTVVSIDSVEDFTAFAMAVTANTEYKGVQVANNKNVFVKLTTDLNLDGVNWGAGTAAPNAIGNGSNNVFQGIFDGKNHTISNYTVTGTWAYNRALFRTVGDGFTIKNITFDNCKSVSGTDNPTQKTGGAAIVCGGVSGAATFENVTVKDSRVEANRGAAAIAGFGNQAVMTFTNCTVENVEIVSGEQTGILTAYVLSDYAGNDIIVSGNTATNVTWTDETGADRTADLVAFHKESDTDGVYDNYDINGNKVDLMINTIDDLKAFAAAVNAGDNFAGMTVKLGADIEVNDYWFNNETGVDYIIKNFAGTFDGQGHTITGMKYNFYISTTATGDFSGPAMGLFGTVEAEGVVKNLTLDTVTADITIDGTARLRAGFGFLACSLKGTAENCHVKNVTVNTNGRIRESGAMFIGVSGTATGCTATNVSINSTSASGYTFEDMGGFAGVVTGKLEDCHIDTVSITADNPEYGSFKKVGGFIGRTNSNSVVTNCTAKNVTLSATTLLCYTGGFVGHAENSGSATYTDCSVEDVTIKTNNGRSTQTGGFVGEAYGVTFDNCDATDVTINVGVAGSGKVVSSTAGFCGQTNQTGATFKNCDVTGLDMTVAGVIENGLGGFLTSTGGSGATIENCTVAGTIDATATTTAGAVGGFLGNLGWGGAAANTITGSSANVDITANGNVGGFVGKAESSNASASLEIIDCTASGDITSNNGEANEFAGIGETGTPAEGEYTFTGEIDSAVIIISTLDELKAFVAAVNAGDNFAGKTVKLGADIEVNDYWFNNETGVDFRITKDFAGTFDGAGYSIKGLKFQNTDITKNPNMYLFNSISGTVKNLTLDGVDADINGYDYFGFIAYKLTGTAENCHVKNVDVDVAVASNGNGYISASGAMFGQIVSATVTDCTATDVTFTCEGNDNTDNVGALIGHASGTADKHSTITGCSVTDFTVNAARKTKRLGGFIGYTNYTDVTDCSVNNFVATVGTYYQSVGGFVGNATNASTFTRCEVNGFTMNGSTTDSDYAGDVGGFAGYTYSNIDDAIVFTDCEVTGLDMNLECNDDNAWTAGGFLGYANSNVDIDGCDVSGTIDVTGTGADHVTGGFIGTLDWTSDKTVTVDGSQADVDITTTSKADEFVGEGNDTVTYTQTESENIGTVIVVPSGSQIVTIGSAADFDAFAAAVNGQTTYQGVNVSWNKNLYVLITADIDMSQVTFTTAIGSYGNGGGFSGTLDGQGHTLSNYTVSGNWNYARALFRQASDITVKDITFDSFNSNAAGATDIKTRPAGIIFASVLGEKNVFENVTLTNSILYGDNGLGTLMGYGSGAYDNSYVTEYSFINCNVSNCTIYSETDRAAILGEFGRDGDVILTIEGCTFANNKLIATIDGVTTTSDLPVWYNHGAAAIEKDGKFYTYEYIDDAIDAAIANGGTIVLAKDITLTEEQSAAAMNSAVKFDLNGYALTVPEGYVLKANDDGTYSVIEFNPTNWIQVADTSWYVEGQTEFILTTPEQLAGLAQLVNEGNPFTALIIKLGADLDLTALEWTPIGLTSATPFSGHFDGQNHTITGLNMTSAYTNAGLFGYIKNNTVDYLSSFENVTFNNVTISNATNAGALFGDAKFAQRHEWYGGIIQIHNVNVTGDVKIDAVNAGAVTGSEWLGVRLAASNVVVNVNEGSYVHGSAVAGGVFASTPHSGGETAKIEKISSNIDVIGEGFVGGIAGRAGWTLDDLTFTGTVTATNTTNAGLIFGQILDNNYWSKNVDLVGMTNLNGEGATLTIDGVAGTQLFPATGWSGKSEFAYVEGKVHEKSALVSIDGGEGVLMTWPEAMVAIEGKTATITLTLANGASWTYEYGIKVPANTTLTIDLNGMTLEGTIFSEGNLTIKNGSILSYEFTSAIESYGENAVLTIEDGVTVKSYRHAIRAEGGKVVINGGVFQTWGRTGEAETVHALNAGGAFATEVIINGGEFRGIQYDGRAETPDSGAAINAQNNATVTITGGKFSDGQNETLRTSGTGKIIVKGGEFDQDPTAFVANGYMVEAVEDYFIVVEDKAVATIGDVRYDTIEAAFAAAKNGDTITLLTDITEASLYISGKTFTLDLNGKTLDISGDWMSMISIVDGSNVTITGGGSITGGGMLGLLTVGSGSTLTFAEDAGSINGKLFIESGSTNTINLNGGIYSEDFLPSDISISTVTKGENVDVAAPDGYKWENNTKLIFEPITWAGKTLLYKDIIRLKFILTTNFKDVAAENFGLEVWDSMADFESGKAPTLYDTFAANGSSNWEVVTDGIPAKNMGDVKYYRAYVEVNGERYYTDVLEYSPAVYAEYIYRNSTKLEFKELVIALMNYGTAAQNYFGYDVENPMNSFLTPAERADIYDESMLIALNAINPDKLASEKDYFGKIEKNVQFKGAISMMFRVMCSNQNTESKLLYWSAADYEANATLNRGNATKAIDLTVNGDYLVGLNDGISVKNLGDTGYYCFYIVDENGVGHYSELIAYSAHTYAEDRIANSTNANMQELARRLVVFTDKAANALVKK